MIIIKAEGRKTNLECGLSLPSNLYAFKSNNTNFGVRSLDYLNTNRSSNSKEKKLKPYKLTALHTIV